MWTAFAILTVCVVYILVVFIYSEIEVYLDKDPLDWILGR
jgi:hypothetical protein